jgi:glycosyltransferase involved in cell wall biosynthesis
VTYQQQTFDHAHPLLEQAAGDTPLLSIIVPVKDEQEQIAIFVARVSVVLDQVAPEGDWEILFIDDGSSDGTLAVIGASHERDPRVRGLSLSRNFGKEAALSAGLDYASGRAVVPLDVDLQDPPELMVEMVAKWRAGADVVYGVRRNRETDRHLTPRLGRRPACGLVQRREDLGGAGGGHERGDAGEALAGARGANQERARVFSAGRQVAV